MDPKVRERYLQNLRARGRAILEELMQQKNDFEHWNDNHLPHEHVSLEGLDEQIEAAKRGDFMEVAAIGERVLAKHRAKYPEDFEP